MSKQQRGRPPRLKVPELKVVRTDAGFKLQWEGEGADPRSVVFYRVTSSDSPLDVENPHRGEIVKKVTDGTEVTDERPLTHATRYVQVWRYSGRTDDDAENRAPRLIAQTTIIGTVQHFQVEQLPPVEGKVQVQGTWEVLQGTHDVELIRTRSGPSVNDETKSIPVDDISQGFTDEEVEPGAEYCYAATVIASGAGTMTSEWPVKKCLTVCAPQPVKLKVELSEPNSNFLDIEWVSPPAGTVSIYCTSSDRPSGLTDTIYSGDELRRKGFDDSDLVVTAFPTNEVPARRVEVNWPEAQHSVYLTPVTELDGLVAIGQTSRETRAPRQAGNVHIIERCYEQILGFEWPLWATRVSVFVADPGVSAEDAAQFNKPVTVTEPDFRRDGGLRFKSPLGARPCVIHVRPEANLGLVGKFRAAVKGTKYGTPTSTNYLGLRQVHYRVNQVVKEKKKLYAYIRLETSDGDLSTVPALLLVRRHDRLPLSVEDGQVLTAYDLFCTKRFPTGLTLPRIEPGNQRALQCSTPLWRVSLASPEQGGFIRLFAAERRDMPTLAVIDPPLSTLVPDPNPGNRG